VALLNALTQVDHVVTMTQGGPSDATNLLLYYIYQQAEQNFDPGVASAATVVSVLALLALALLAVRVSDRNAHHAS
jgi:sn-glycerol 3-phosphate transport system permease protein